MLREIEQRIQFAGMATEAARKHREEVDARQEEGKKNIKVGVLQATVGVAAAPLFLPLCRLCRSCPPCYCHCGPLSDLCCPCRLLLPLAGRVLLPLPPCYCPLGRESVAVAATVLLQLVNSAQSSATSSFWHLGRLLTFLGCRGSGHIPPSPPNPTPQPTPPLPLTLLCLTLITPARPFLHVRSPFLPRTQASPLLMWHVDLAASPLLLPL